LETEDWQAVELGKREYGQRKENRVLTTENLIGNPSDNTLYGDTLQLFQKRMGDDPDTVVTRI